MQLSQVCDSRSSLNKILTIQAAVERLTAAFPCLNVAVDLGLKLSHRGNGLALPNGGQSICKDGVNDDRFKTGIAAGKSAIFFRPLRQNSGLEH
jgi:hypothetical protein